MITRVEGVHLELFGGDIESVARAKGELIESLPTDGIAVLNADHRYVAAMADRTSARVLRYGLSSDADVYASAIVVDDELRASFRLHTPVGGFHRRAPGGGAGEHQVPNALAAAAAGGGLGVAIEDIANGMSAAELSGLRMELAKARDGGAIVLNDAYNANPTSMSAALKSLAALPVRRRVAVLGTMAELGSDSPAQHLAIALEAHELGIEVIAVDEPNYGDTARHASGVDEAVAALGDLADGDALLVKGSRVAALERVAQALLA